MTQRLADIRTPMRPGSAFSVHRDFWVKTLGGLRLATAALGQDPGQGHAPASAEGY